MAKQPGSLNFVQKSLIWMAAKSVSAKLTDEDFVTRITGGETASGVVVNTDSAMRVSAVWSCVRVLAETIGSLPMSIYERDKNGNSVKVDHDLADVLIRSPNADMTSQEMREAQMVNLGLVGNAYTLIERSGKRVTSLYPVPSSEVMPHRDKSTGVITYKYNGEFLPADRVWHLKGFGGNGLVGLSPIGNARQSVGFALAAEDFGSRFFKNGAKTSGIIKLDKWLKDDQRVMAQANIDKLWSGLVNAHKIQLLEGGMEYQNITMPLEDAQFIETRKFQINEICRIYRVPPYMVSDLDGAIRANVEQQSQDFVQFTLLPYFIRYEQTIQKRLFSPADRSRFFVRFNYEGLLRADSTARAALYSVMLQNGVYNRNEVRALENLPYSNDDGMNDHTVQSNMTLVQLLEQMAGGQQQ